ncbi:hypothetical protein DQ384_05580 [Sphaerisporangium album]|uniref:DUF6879 domain-containing protein n=1 Tax=Sphaerisporangium album TaxID=509200 RepID=A0A367FQ94_9ACTN|nr:DUF6879 family protein [Sphaerisporangium album]RCG32012.1 hypothetical protein DQ384_05580 [Sphaerisporangium album]
MDLLTREEFQQHFRTATRAFHLELKDSYNVAHEDEPFRKWQAGEHDDHAWRRPWQAFIREVTGAGCVMQRVRVVTVPHTPYTRWLLDIAGDNVKAGEDIRYLPRHLAADVDFPPEDCWLFDDERLVLSVFPGDGRAGAFVTETDAALIHRYRVARDTLWERSIPHADYVQRVV